MHIVVSDKRLDVVALQGLCDVNPAVGAVANFIGLMRDSNEGQQVSAMYLDHYPAMTEKVLHQIMDEAASRWPLLDAVLAHRVGAVNVGDVLVYVEARTRHRQDAFDACNYMMDVLKTRAPFWKKELIEGGERWVAGRDSDTQALDKWCKDN